MGAVRLRSQFLAAVGMSAAVLVPKAAQCEPVIRIPVSVGAAASSNPFLRTIQAKSGQSIYTEVQPTIAWSSEISEVTLSGQLRYDRFLKNYQDDTSVRIALDVTRALSEVTSIRAHTSARSARANGIDILLPGPSLNPNGGASTPPPSVIPDVAFGGVRGRTTTLEAGAGVTHALNERDQLSFDAGVSLNRFSDRNSSDSRVANALIGFSRALSERSKLSASVDATVVDYLGRRDGDGAALSPTVAWEQQLNEQTTLSVGAGVSVIRRTGLLGDHETRASLAGRANLCTRGSSFSYCLRVSRVAQATATGGLDPVLSAGGSGSLVLNRKDRLGFDASYTRSSQTRLTSGEQTELLQASTTLSREFSPRLAAFVAPSYTKSFSNLTSSRTNTALRVGIRYRFGAIG